MPTLLTILAILCMTKAFDELLLLKRGGRTIYHGPIGVRAVDLVKVRTKPPVVMASTARGGMQ